jgi:exopolysaccharide biosynthesis polyprenyl glycosylphosphotransferase
VSDLNGVKVLGKVEDVKTYLLQNHVDEVVLSSARELDLEDLLSICEEEGVRTRLIPNLLNKTESKWGIEKIGDMVSLRLYGVHEKEWQIFFKRIVDICLSGILLLLLAPLFILIAVVIKRTSRGPVFYEWNVVGFNKKPFKSWKFRTMVTDADKLKDELMEKNEMKGPVFKIKDDPRITPVGKIMRKFSLDELPQLYSVLKGDMSLVGPRPPLNSEVSMFKRWHGRKLRIKPGITCLWQVNGRNGIKDFDEWVKLDLEYLDNWSLWLDMKILLKTIPAVLRATGH